jgi:PAS domain S-box-containing protein
MFGYAPGEMIGGNVSVLIPPDRPPGAAHRSYERLRRGERVEYFETKLLRKDGSIIDVSVSVSPIRDASGTVVGVSTVARDMTERNRAEAERQALEGNGCISRSGLRAWASWPAGLPMTSTTCWPSS